MKNMNHAKEFWDAPPPGTYPAVITTAEPGFTAKGDPKITITVEFTAETGEFAGTSFTDTLMTDGDKKGAGISKRKLRGLGVDVDSGIEIDDRVICQKITGLHVMAKISNEQLNSKDEAGNYTKPMTRADETGKLVPVMRAKGEDYALVNVGARPATHAGAQVAQQPAQQPQQWQGQPQYVQQVAQQPAPQYVQQPQYAPQPGAPMQPQFAPQSGQPMQPQFGVPPGMANPPWGNGAQQGPPAEAKPKRKVKVTEAEE